MGTFWPVFLQLIWALQGSTAGNVGCLFNEDLCEQVTEWCYDDGAFGRCMDTEDPTPASELFRHSLDEEDLGVLEAELQKLLERGYGWNHPHTQCILQGLLYDFQEGKPLEDLECDHLKDPELEAALNLPTEEELAYIRFTPSAGDPQSDFADEVYIPHPGDEDLEAPEMGPPPRPSPFRQLYNSPSNFRSGVEVRDLIAAVPGERERGKRNKIAGTYAALKSKLDNWPDEEGEVKDRDDFNFDPVEFTKYIQSALRPSYFFRTVPTTNLVAGSNNRNIADNNDEIEYEVEKERVMVADDDSRGYTEGGNVFQSAGLSWKRKVLNLNGVAKWTKGYKGSLLNDDSNLEATVTRSKEKQQLTVSVLDTLSNLFPSSNYFKSCVDTGLGFLIDAECIIDSKMNPSPLVDKKTGQPIEENKTTKKNRIAIFIHEYHDCTRGRVELAGPAYLNTHLAGLIGYKVVNILYTDYNVRAKLIQRVQYMEGLLKSAVAEST